MSETKTSPRRKKPVTPKEKPAAEEVQHPGTELPELEEEPGEAIPPDPEPEKEAEEKIMPPVMQEPPRINLIAPNARPWKLSGRVIVQPFRIRTKTSGGIEIVAVNDGKRIPADSRLYVVAIDEKNPACNGIQVGDEVIFADDFVPTSKILDGIFYYVPHYLDILLIIRNEQNKPKPGKH